MNLLQFTYRPIVIEHVDSSLIIVTLVIFVFMFVTFKIFEKKLKNEKNSRRNIKKF